MSIVNFFAWNFFLEFCVLHGNFGKIFHVEWKFCEIFPYKIPQFFHVFWKIFPARIHEAYKMFMQTRLGYSRWKPYCNWKHCLGITFCTQSLCYEIFEFVSSLKRHATPRFQTGRLRAHWFAIDLKKLKS